MARDSRHGKDRAKQVSLSKRAAESGRKKTDFPVGRVVLMVLGLLAVIAGIFFVRAVIQFVRGGARASGGGCRHFFGAGGGSVRAGVRRRSGRECRGPEAV